LFKVPDGYVIPVVFGQSAKVVTVNVRNVAGIDKVVCHAIYPGKQEIVSLKSVTGSGFLQIEVPLIRGCAMVKIESVK
jgi:hypothetical protein